MPRQHGRCHGSTELAQIDRLGQVVIGTGLERLHGVLRRAVGGDDDGLFVASAFIDAAQQIQSRAIGQAHVGDDELVAAGPTLLQQRPGFLDAARAVDVVAFAQQRQLVQGAQIGLVVDNQQAGARQEEAPGRTGSQAQPRSSGSTGWDSAVVARRSVTTNSLRSRSAARRGRYSMVAS